MAGGKLISTGVEFPDATTQTSATNTSASTTELDILDGATLTTTEINYVDGVTSDIQTQINSKQATIADNGLSGDKIDGGTISNFTSTGIDDNATSTKLSVSNDGVSIGGSTPYGLSTTLLPASGATGSDHANIQLKIGEVSQNAAYYNAIGYVLHPTHGHCGSMQSISGNNPAPLLLNETGGQVRVGSGGITFNGDTAAANALDDYEEGTWTPTITGYSSGSTQTYSSQSGKYTKIGNMVYAHFYVALSSKGNISGNYVFLEGFPFNHDAANGGDVIISGFSGQANNTYWVGGDMTSTATAAWMTRGVAATGTYMMTAADLTNTSSFHGTCVYRV